MEGSRRWPSSQTAIPAKGAGGRARPSVAVLHCGNTTGDQSLDCMRTAIADMVVTDLSQSPQVEVVSTEHLSVRRYPEALAAFERDVVLAPASNDAFTGKVKALILNGDVCSTPGPPSRPVRPT